MVVLITGVIFTIIRVIEVVATSTTALSQEVKTHVFINLLVKNSSQMWHVQHIIELVFRDEWDSLKDAGFWMGRETKSTYQVKTSSF